MYRPKTPVRRHCFYCLGPRIDGFVRNLGVFSANAELAWLSQLTGQTTRESAPAILFQSLSSTTNRFNYWKRLIPGAGGMEKHRFPACPG